MTIRSIWSRILGDNLARNAYQYGLQTYPAHLPPHTCKGSKLKGWKVYRDRYKILLEVTEEDSLLSLSHTLQPFAMRGAMHFYSSQGPQHGSTLFCCFRMGCRAVGKIGQARQVLSLHSVGPCGDMEKAMW